MNDTGLKLLLVTVAPWSCHWLGSCFLLRESRVTSYWKNRAPKWDLSLCMMSFVSVKQVAISVLLLDLEANNIARDWTWWSLCVPSSSGYSILWLNYLLFWRADKWNITKPRAEIHSQGSETRTQGICCSLEAQHRENQPSHWGMDFVMAWEVELGGFSISVFWSCARACHNFQWTLKLQKECSLTEVRPFSPSMELKKSPSPFSPWCILSVNSSGQDFFLLLLVCK